MVGVTMSSSSSSSRTFGKMRSNGGVYWAMTVLLHLMERQMRQQQQGLVLMTLNWSLL
jgi:hypothetical protein